MRQQGFGECEEKNAKIQQTPRWLESFNVLLNRNCYSEDLR